MARIDISSRAHVHGRLVTIVDDTTYVRQQLQTGDFTGLERIRRHRISVELGLCSFNDCLFVLAFPLEEGVLTDRPGEVPVDHEELGFDAQFAEVRRTAFDLFE